MKTYLHHLILLLIAGIALAACSPERDSGTDTGTAADNIIQLNDVAAELQLALLEATPGDIIELPAGTFHFDRGLTLNVDNITLRGAGINDTVLSFRDQVAGADGLLVTGSHFTIEDLAIEDSIGDALKVRGGDHIVIRRVRTEWTRGPHVDNGSYGIYPVQTRHTLVEDSVAIGASDAGLYIGQSENVIVRNNRVEYNVAGIEIENSVDADVYGNVAINNTGGILVFNMPNLPVAGHSTRVFGNQVMGNNTENFAPPGTAVSSVPSGSGIIINSNDKVEIFDNDIAGNDTANILVSSYYSVGYAPRETAEVFDPYPEMIFIYNNRFGPAGQNPALPDLRQLRDAMFGESGRLPDIVWDGISHPERQGPEYAICVDNGDDVQLLNMDAGNNAANARLSIEEHRCEHEKLPQVQLPAGLLASQ